MPSFGKLTQAKIFGPAHLTVVFSEEETIALDPRSITDAIIYQYVSEALRSTRFRSPEKVLDWWLTLKRYSRQKSEAWLEVVYE